MAWEVAGGGMGVVFAGRQLRLDRPVAIKILRPEHATAVAAERFLAEGRLLARLAHPNIVPIYDAGESDGLLYYVMEFVEGETLADRLKRGSLPPAEAIRLARELLAALSAAHEQDVVHRDVKPANIFLRGSQILLGDFGIARWRRDNEPGLTQSGQYIGTPSYMAPEQREGVAATARSDVYSTGMVIYESCTGRRWPAYQPPERADWSGVPNSLAVSVRRALALDPAERWPDAKDFAVAIGAAGRPRRRALFAAAAGILGLVVWAVWPGPSPPESRRTALTLSIDRFDVQGAGRALGDSVSARVRSQLASFADFTVADPGRPVPDSALRVSGRLIISNGRAQVAATTTRAGGQESGTTAIRFEEPSGDWRRIADGIVTQLVVRLARQGARSDPWLPYDRTVPVTDSGVALWFKAEQLYSLGHWDEALAAYQAVDSGCLLCYFRLLDIRRWLGLAQDSVQLAALLREQARFPAQYQSLIRAAGTTLPAGRLDSLQAATGLWLGFYLAPFEYGDELFHRGPLYGRRRVEAVGQFQSALGQRPRFGPGLEHFAWLLMSEGDSASAAEALHALTDAPPVNGFAEALRVLLDLGYSWRFLPLENARQRSLAVLALPGIATAPAAIAGARLMMTMDAPRGAVELGGMLARWRARRDAAPDGLLGQLFGYAALGRLDSVAVTGTRLAGLSDPSFPLLALELEAVIRAFDPDPAVRVSPRTIAALDRAVREYSADSRLRWRAAFALGILAARSRDTGSFRVAKRNLTDEPAPAVLAALLSAAAAGASGQAARALQMLPVLPPLEAEAQYRDPLEDAVTRLLRAEWEAATGDSAAARATLRWHEHMQISGHLTGPPQAGEMAWALGTLARWRRAGLLTAMGVADSEWCGVNRAIQRIWADGEPVFRARAAAAGSVASTPACMTAP